MATSGQVQFRLATLLQVTTLCAVVLALFRVEAAILAYHLVPVTVYCGTSRRLRWRATSVAMLLLVALTVPYLVYQAGGFTWTTAALLAIGGGVLSMPFWIGPILLWELMSDNRKRRHARLSSPDIPEVGEEELEPFQFRLSALLMATTIAAVLFSLLRYGGLLMLIPIYFVAPMAVFYLAPLRQRWPLTLGTAILPPVFIAIYVISINPNNWVGVVGGLTSGAVVMAYVWVVPILFWQFLTTPTRSRGGESVEPVAPCSRSELVEIPPIETRCDIPDESPTES